MEYTVILNCTGGRGSRHNTRKRCPARKDVRETVAHLLKTWGFTGYDVEDCIRWAETAMPGNAYMGQDFKITLEREA